MAIVGRVADELAVERDVERLGERHIVISLDDPLWSGVRQLAVTYQDAKPAGVEIALVRARDRVVESGNSDLVVGSAPGIALDGGAGDDRAIGVDELERFDIAVGDTTFDEQRYRL